jgi:uncharacterized protein YndB with AHSA1/START domain
MLENKRSLVAPVLDRIIHVSVWLPKSPDVIFGYFTRNTLLESWLTARAEVEPNLGGKYELYWEPNDPENNSTIGCRITAIQQPELLSFQWRSPMQFKGFANGADPLTHVTVALIGIKAGTSLHLVHSGWGSSSEWEEARVWQDRAWSMGIQTLVRVVGG